MVGNPPEAGEFARVADGVLINLGTSYEAWSPPRRLWTRTNTP